MVANPYDGHHLSFFHLFIFFILFMLLVAISVCYSEVPNHNTHGDLQFLFESRNDVTVMPCGHTIHKHCLKEMRDHLQ